MKIVREKDKKGSHLRFIWNKGEKKTRTLGIVHCLKGISFIVLVDATL